jgi:succinyl-diaminopimelate desuccinylase
MSLVQDLAAQLIECPSITPADEGCQGILIKRLQNLHFHIEKLNFNGVANFWAVHGTAPPILVFAGHTDVVPPGDLKSWSSDPFKATVKEGYLYGRGAADMKGSLAAMMVAAERFIAAYPDHPGTLAFLITGDEEGAAEEGTKKVVEHLKHKKIRLDYCIVGEPSSVKTLGDTIKIGRRGSLGGKLKILGAQGHVAYPHLAHNPIHAALAPLLELTSKQWDSGTKDFPATSFQISNLHSGTGAGNVIPGILECLFNFRFNPTLTPEVIQKAVDTLLKKHSVSYEIDWSLYGTPFLTVPGQLLAVTIQVLENVLGKKPKCSTSGGTSDARFIREICPEIIELGPCNETIHQVNECIKVEALEKLSELYEKILAALLTT